MAENKQKSTTENIKKPAQGKKSSGVGRLKPAHRASWLIIVGAIVLLVGVGTYVVARLTDNNKADSTTYDEPENPRFPKEEVRLEQLDITALQTRVDKLQLSNQYKDAKKLVKYQRYYEKNKQAQLLYASLCANQGNPSEALQTMLGVEKKFGESGNLSATIAQQASGAGDKKKAIEYYEKAIELTEKDRSNPVGKADANLYRQELKKLEGN